MKKFNYDPVRWGRISLLFLLDILVVNGAVLASLLTRFELRVNTLARSGYVEMYFRMAVVYTVVTLVIFSLFRLYRSLWEYASVEELTLIVYAVVAADVALCLIQHPFGIRLPRSLPVLNLFFLTVGIGGVRYLYRLLRHAHNRPSRKRVPVMLIGAGAAGAMVLKEMEHSARSDRKVVCIIDDDVRKHGSFLMGVPVVGGREMIPAAAEKYHVSDILLAVPTASPGSRREIVEICQKTSCHIRTMPALYQLVNGQVSTKQIRDVSVEDLLGRDKVQVDLGEIGGCIRDRTVLVTGGGGSIGSELCRQIARQRPKKLIIFDIYENNAYDIQQELIQTCPGLNLEVLIGSVRDRRRVEEVFDTHRPQLVCHAAAHKHVPLMEDNPNEAIKNNVFGTLHVAKAADKFGAEKFVLISSDKAVNPTNVMGATKRICEMIIQVVGQKSQTVFSAVRFGNVLGSNGSVIPLFRRQIERGGPVTVTHREVIRYFMTISEAVSLVLQACSYAKGGEIFVLDMGDPVRIDDLARNMIRLSGFEPEVDIPIVYTGLRPGEKLFEELLLQEEGLERTPNELIFVGRFRDFDPEGLMDGLEELSDACMNEAEDIRSIIRRMVRTYQPQN